MSKSKNSSVLTAALRAMANNINAGTVYWQEADSMTLNEAAEKLERLEAQVASLQPVAQPFGYVVGRNCNLGPTESVVVHGANIEGLGQPLYIDYGHQKAWSMVIEELRKEGVPKPAVIVRGTGIEETRQELQHLVALAQDGERFRATFESARDPDKFVKFVTASDAVCPEFDIQTIEQFRKGIDAGIEATRNDEG